MKQENTFRCKICHQPEEVFLSIDHECKFMHCPYMEERDNARSEADKGKEKRTIPPRKSN